MLGAPASRRLGFHPARDADVQQRIWAYAGPSAPAAQASLQFPADAPTTPFPDRRSAHEPTVPFPDRRSVPFERHSLLPEPEPDETRLAGAPERPVTPPRSGHPHSPSPDLSPPYPLTPPAAQSADPVQPSPTTTPAVHTQIHLLDFAADASADKLRRGRVLPLHLGAAARHVLLVRAERAFDLFPECGVALTVAPGVRDTELVVAIEEVGDWAEADAALAAAFPAAFCDVPECVESVEGAGYGAGDGAGGGEEGLGEDTPARAAFALSAGAGAGAQAQAKRRACALVPHDTDDVYLVSGPGPGFANWLLAGLADALQLNPRLRVCFAAVHAWDPRWVRPHWAGAIVEDLLGLSAPAAAAMGPMRIHLHSGIKQAGRSQHAWSRQQVDDVRERRVRYLDHGAWEALKREIGAGRT